MNKFKTIITIILALSILILSFPATGEENENPIKPGSIEINKEDITTYPEKAKIDFHTAIENALKEIPGKLLETELACKEGYLIYEVEIVTEDKNIMEVIVDAGTEEILWKGPEEDEAHEDYEDTPCEIRIKPGSIKLEDLNEADFPDLAKITFTEAREIALAKVPGHVLEMELEVEEGFLIYEFEILNYSGELKEVIIDPTTGEILRVVTEYEEGGGTDIHEDIIW